MRRCFSARTWPKQAGASCNRCWTHGRRKNRPTFRTIKPEAPVPKLRIGCRQMTVAPGARSATAGEANAMHISLLLADVDGTLVTENKILTPRALAAVAALRKRNIRLAITSGRPP